MRQLATELQDTMLKSLSFAIEENNVGQIKVASDAADNGRLRCSLILSQYRIRLAHKESEQNDPLTDSPIESPTESATEIMTERQMSISTAVERPAVATRKSSSHRSLPPAAICICPLSTSSPLLPSPPAKDYDNLSYLPNITWFNRKKKDLPSPDGLPKKRLSFFSRRDSGIQATMSPTSPMSFSSEFPAVSPLPGTVSAKLDSPTEPILGQSWTSTNTGLLRLPTSQNNYLGLCRGGTDFARGDEKAFTEEVEWAFGKVPFLLCSYCAFSCKVSRSKIWETRYGVRFRWAFLAKSHVLQTKVKQELHTYKCVFCAYSGIDSPAVQGEDAFLEHIASHRGVEYAGAMLERTRCVNDRYAHDDEDWDINLFPLNGSPHIERVKSVVLSDNLLNYAELPGVPTSMGPFELA